MSVLSSSFEAERSPIVKFKLPEACSTVDIQSNLFRIFNEGMPGFIIHASRLMPNNIVTQEIVVNETLNALHRFPGNAVRPGALFKFRPIRYNRLEKLRLNCSGLSPHISPELTLNYLEEGS